jgi:strictosidine synthase
VSVVPGPIGLAGSYREIVGMRQHDGWLYLGSLHETAVGRVRIPVPGAATGGGAAGG